MKLKSFLVLLGTLLFTTLAVACWILVYNNDTITVLGKQFVFTAKQVESISIGTGVIFLLHLFFNMKNTAMWIDGSLLFVGALNACTIAVFQIINIALENHKPISSKGGSFIIAIVIILFVTSFAIRSKEDTPRL